MAVSSGSAKFAAAIGVDDSAPTILAEVVKAKAARIEAIIIVSN